MNQQAANRLLRRVGLVEGLKVLTIAAPLTRGAVGLSESPAIIHAPRSGAGRATAGDSGGQRRPGVSKILTA